jgi:hypothetical protein
LLFKGFGDANEKKEEKIDFTKDFRFSGNNYSRRRKFVVVDNNAINKTAIKRIDHPLLKNEELL